MRWSCRWGVLSVSSWYILARGIGQEVNRERDARSTEIRLHVEKSREQAVLVVGQMSGHLQAFDAWTGQVINSIDSGGPLVTNCREDIIRDLQPDADSLQSIRQQARTDVALHSPQFDQHNFAPTMDGRLYHMSKNDGEWKEVHLPTSELLQSKKPLRSKDNPELSDVLFVAEKNQRLYTFEPDTGQMYPFFSADAASSSSTPRDSINILMGRVDVTTKMLNLDDVLDFKCVTVSEYFVQFASSAQCGKDTTVVAAASPGIKMTLVAHGGVSLTAFDPRSNAMLWTWESPFDLTMVYGILPSQGSKFFEWSVTGASPGSDETCSTWNEEPASSSDRALMPMANTNLLYRAIDGQTYLLPSPAEALVYQPDNLTNKVVKSRPWKLKSVEVDGEKGFLLTSQHVIAIALAVVVVITVVAHYFYRQGLVAKPRSSSDDESVVSSPRNISTTTPLSTPTLAPSQNPKSPLQRHKTGLDHLLRLVSPAKMQRSLSFGGFSHAPEHHHHNRTSVKSPWANDVNLQRLSDLSNDPSMDSTQSDPIKSQSLPSNEELNKILPYICRGRFANEFDELSVLGKGGFGQVMLAENRLDGRRYAVKRIGLCLHNQPKPTLEKFLREVKILARLDHSYIVRYYQAWLEALGEHDIVPTPSETTSVFSARHETTSSVYTSRNILQHRSSDETSSSDSLYAPRRFAANFDDDDDDDAGGFTWDRSGEETQGNPWSESDVVHESSLETLSVRTQDGRVDHWLYIQMQYCSEQSLADVLATTRPPFHHVLEIFYQIASALEHVHSLGLIHRDLKPANIFVMDHNTIKLGDFGLSRYASSPAPTSSNGAMDLDPSTSQDSIWSSDEEKTAGVGTYLYASPEQISGEMYSAKADMYSLGMILFELMHDTFGTAMERIVTLRNVRDGVLPPKWLPDHPRVVAMIESLVAKRPQLRPNAHDVVVWCQAQLQSKSTSVPTTASAARKENVHVLQVEPKDGKNSNLCHNLLLTLSDVIRMMEPPVAIVACGLKQHMSGQVLEFTLQVESNQELLEAKAAMAACSGVHHVELLVN
ncbi:hypothetical protein AeMF1_021270 [Aphanomyces euteiches]|nr:hypothetical protein AeMF1_021270 [Aphanomyces euteiches]KAH9184649.1 hypothetical protein AeNC1_013377 [Aphanomyces euteiches]